MAGLSDAALTARLVRVAASVLEAPLAALFRLDGDKATLLERVVRLEQASEVTQMTLPAARLKLDTRKAWHAASRTRAPTELVAFPSSTRVAWALSTPLFDAKKNQLGLLVLADMRARAENDDRLAALDDVCELLEDKLTPKPSSDRPHQARNDEPTGRIRTFGGPTLVHPASPASPPPAPPAAAPPAPSAARPPQREESSSERRIPFDAVTGLPDRASLLEETVRRVERASVLQLGLAVVVVALDRFRRVNETLGQSVGDTVLRQVGERLRESVGDADLVGRRSGDEFMVVVADDGSPGGVLALADRLQQAIREPYHLHGHELTITASIGVARFPTDSSDAQSLFRSADIALARAKQAGRGKLVVFDRAMQEAVTTRAELERELRIAMREGHLLLHYQPKFRVKDRALVGAEALLRWRHPTKGLISPGQFIPVAEDSGLIVPIGTWALGEVCRQRAAWQRAGLAMGRVSVNVSALQFARPDFVGTVTRAMRAANVQEGHLELELTESIVMDDVEHVAARLGELRKLGVAVSIDDFGTGYSSLAYLQRLPVDVLKIDRSFVRPLDLGGDEARGAHALAGSIATLARGLGLEVLAEGVETEGQFQALAELGCEVIQGFLLGRPVPAADLEAIARARPA
jgi:diguanylate cyclase (GGDEF)-like protein